MAGKAPNYNWVIKRDPLDIRGLHKLYVDGRIVGKTYFKQISGSPDTQYYGIANDPPLLCYVRRVNNQIIMRTDDGETVLHTFKK